MKENFRKVFLVFWLPFWIRVYLRWRSSANKIQRNKKKVHGFVVSFVVWGWFVFFVQFVNIFYDSSFVNALAVIFLGWVAPTFLLNLFAKKIWQLPSFDGRIVSNAQIDIDELPDAKTAQAPGASDRRGKYKRFALGVREDLSVYWYSLSSFVDGYEVEPFHVLLAGNNGVYREHVANVFLLNAVHVNVKKCLREDTKRILKLLKSLPFVPDAILPFERISNSVIIGLDDKQDGLDMSHLQGAMGTIIITGKHDIKRALIALHEIYKERKDFVEDGSVDIFVLCDHGVANALLGKDPSYSDVNAEMKALIEGGTKRRIKFIAVPSPNVTTNMASRASRERFRIFQFYSDMISNVISKKTGESTRVSVKTVPAYPSLCEVLEPIGDEMVRTKVKCAHIEPYKLRQYFSRLTLTPQALLILSRLMSLPELKRQTKEYQASKTLVLPQGVEFIEGKLHYRKSANQIFAAVHKDGVFYYRQGGRLIEIKPKEDFVRTEPVINFWK